MKFLKYSLWRGYVHGNLLTEPKIRRNTTFFIFFLGALFLTGSRGNAGDPAGNLILKINQPSYKTPWYNLKKLTSKDDLTIETKGRICGKKGDEHEERFHPTLTGVENSSNYEHYTAKKFQNGKGYVLVKEFNGWEDGGIIEVCFTRFEPQQDCYLEKKLDFKASNPPSWSIEDCWEEGCFSGLFVSKDGKLILKIQLMETVQKVGKYSKNIIQVKDETFFFIYSLETLKQVDNGKAQSLRTKEFDDRNNIRIHGVVYEPFREWFEKSKDLTN